MLLWVIGSGGLLGSSVEHACEARAAASTFTPGGPRLPWGSDRDLAPGFQALTARFLHEAVARGADGWAVVWCAGSAVVASQAADVAADGRAWDMFLSALGAALDATPDAARLSGHLLLGSSAGGVWAGHTGPPITESTPVRAISEYGRGQLTREDALLAFGARRPAVRTAVVRLSNLYGPGQRLDKPQGLVSHVARSLIHRRPVHIYVPLDTVRDYLFAADAGHGVVDVLAELARTPVTASRPLVKILASENEISVGGLVSLFRRVTRRQVAVIAGLSPLGRLQPLSLRFRSEVWAGAGRRHRTPLPEGVAQVYRHQLEQFKNGALPFVQ